jgi:hypothetical protein
MENKELEIQINLENAAFENRGEIARILKLIASQIESGSDLNAVKDINGNRTGFYVIKDIAA